MSKRRHALRRRAASDPALDLERPAAALIAARVRPTKARGQNFLVQARIADRIVAAAELEPADE
ncbi:MAG TPA: hypothetical protein VMD75_03395, partial [Candidatus Binataceae bacterium]|nr:hypothetical protein [Candidatus Binataceae bacterium]